MATPGMGTPEKPMPIEALGNEGHLLNKLQSMRFEGNVTDSRGNVIHVKSVRELIELAKETRENAN